MKSLETERLNIRELNLDDTTLIYKYSLEETMKNELPDQVYNSLDETQEVIEFLCTNYNSTPETYPLVCGVTLRKTNTLIGHVGLSEVSNGFEIGYAISMEYQGNGYATEAVGAFSKWAKNNLKLDAIYGIVKESNKGSQKVLINNHFVFQKDVFSNSFGGKYLNKIFIL
ncbi:MAG: GNAT family N-acetyltransferase [Sporolactobacillus sp.]